MGVALTLFTFRVRRLTTTVRARLLALAAVVAQRGSR